MDMIVGERKEETKWRGIHGTRGIQVRQVEEPEQEGRAMNKKGERRGG
jgi:hypothetical protein